MSNIQCRSCGAIFDDHLSECPYCGATCIKGSENAFLRYLKKLTRRVADAPAQYAREGQKAWKHVVILVALDHAGRDAGSYSSIYIQ